MNAASSPGATRPSILVVEDFHLLRASVIQWLKFRFPGCNVQGVGSGEEALVHARTFPTDIVLMDIDLPGINGLEATQRLRVESPESAVVMLTMHDTPNHRNAAADAGAVAYVAKVELEDRLGEVIEELLGSRAGEAS
jgi:DNA-binding NarL/FixJ family response regulator